MDTIVVDKAALMEKVRGNRDAHRDQFLEAQVKFRERAIELLDEHLADARAGRNIRLKVELPVPQDYTESYDTVLAMLEWDQAETVELSRQDFERYVENKWEWRQQFAATTGSYLVQ